MTAKQIANIALRLLGAFWTLSAIIALPNLLQLSSAADTQTRKMMLGSGIGELVWLIAGATVFLKSESIAALFFPGTEQLSVSATAQELQQVGFSLVSVYFGVLATGRVAGLVYVAMRSEPLDESRLSYLWRFNPERLVSAAVELIVCVVLFFGSKALSQFWWRLRGRPANEQNSPAE
jgi:hypothetical protein